jgi:hypothetical protein
VNILVRSALLCAAMAAVACVPARAGNLLVNGGFDTGDFTGWTMGDPGDTYVGLSTSPGYPGFAPENGLYLAYFGTSGHQTTLSQTFTDLAGSLYKVTFYLEGGALQNGEINNFSASIDSTLLTNISQLNSLSYKEYTFTFMGTGSDTLEFSSENDNNYFGLDDVSVMSAAPEPSSVMLLGTGVVALMGLWVRRRLA